LENSDDPAQRMDHLARQKFQKAVKRKKRMVFNHSLAAPWLAKKDPKDKEE